MTDCPVCGKKNNTTMLPAPPQYEWGDEKFDCQGKGTCNMFIMHGEFLRNDWPTVSPEKKAAIAVYLQNWEEEPKEPRDPQRCLPRISKETYQYFVSEGKRNQRDSVRNAKSANRAANIPSSTGITQPLAAPARNNTMRPLSFIFTLLLTISSGHAFADETPGLDNPRVQNGIGVRYYKGEGTPRNYTEAANWYRKAAEQGLAEAQYNLGVAYDQGTGVLKDDTEAVNWFRKAADQGFAKAQYNLGAEYYQGTGVLKDDTEAVKWYRKAAEQGDDKAQFNLGVMYAKGAGMPRSEAEAVKWFRKAADQGNVKAQTELGAVYAKGKGVTRDYVEALKWYRKAADQGFAEAQALLGAGYSLGEGAPRDFATAYMWISLATTNGVKGGQDFLDLLKKQMTQDQVDEGQKLAREWTAMRSK